MLRRLFRNAIILNWSALILLESLAIGTIIFLRAKQHTIARLLHAKGLSPPRAVWVRTQGRRIESTPRPHGILFTTAKEYDFLHRIRNGTSH